MKVHWRMKTFEEYKKKLPFSNKRKQGKAYQTISTSSFAYLIESSVYFVFCVPYWEQRIFRLLCTLLRAAYIFLHWRMMPGRGCLADRLARVSLLSLLRQWQMTGSLSSLYRTTATSLKEFNWKDRPTISWASDSRLLSASFSLAMTVEQRVELKPMPSSSRRANRRVEGISTLICKNSNKK